MNQLMEFHLDNCTAAYRFEETKRELIDFPNLSEPIKTAIQTYLETKQGEEITGLYKLILSKIEAPLLRCLLERTHHNQTQTAIMLSLNRGTLRKKMKQYNLLVC